MPFDEDLIAVVRALPEVAARCVGRKIYHFEVLMGEGFNNFPCIAYEMISDIPFMEMNEITDMRSAVFQFTCLSRNSEDIRLMSNDIQQIQPLANAEFDWLETADTTDGFDAPIDLNEIGMKFTQVTVTIFYRV
jgi:hypothetical protein